MPSTGFINATSTQAYSFYTQWAAPRNIKRCNGTYATGDYLEFLGIKFDIQSVGNIPVNSTVDGFEMNVTGRRNSGSPSIFHWLSKDGVNLSTTNFNYAWTSTTPSTQTFGGATNDWGFGPPPIKITSGIAIYAIIGNFAASSAADYDCVQINTYYTLAPNPPNSYIFKSGNYGFKSGNSIYK